MAKVLLRFATVCFALSVMLSHGERCDGNYLGIPVPMIDT